MTAKVEFETTAGLQKEFLQALAAKGIALEEMRHTQFGFVAMCHAKHYKVIAHTARIYQCKTKLLSKKGLYFTAVKLLARKGLMAGAVIYFILSYIYSNMVWRIDIYCDDGNLKGRAASMLHRQGVYCGVFYSQEKFESASQMIMAQSPDIGYVSLNFYKGTLDCHVYSAKKKEDYISDLSDRDIYSAMAGTVTDLRVYEGFPRVEPGQSVYQGQLLVSTQPFDQSAMPFYTQTRAYIEAECQKQYMVYVPYEKQATVLSGRKSGQRQVIHPFGSHTFGREEQGEQMIVKRVRAFDFCGFRLPVTVADTIYYEMDQIYIGRDFVSAQNAAKTQIQHMIDSDERLKKELERSYDYKQDRQGVQVVCTLRGHYVIS